MKIFTAESSAILRIGEIDRTEEITAKYRCILAPDQNGIQLHSETLDPPEIFPRWDAAGVERRATWWKREVDEGGTFFMAEDNGRVVGLVVVGPERENEAAEIPAMFVDRDYRGQGLGKQLMSKAEAAARKRGVKNLYLYANETVPTVQFYQRVGFQIICLLDTTVMWLPTMGTSIVMAKKL